MHDETHKSTTASKSRLWLSATLHDFTATPVVFVPFVIFESRFEQLKSTYVRVQFVQFAKIPVTWNLSPQMGCFEFNLRMAALHISGILFATFTKLSCPMYSSTNWIWRLPINDCLVVLELCNCLNSSFCRSQEARLILVLLHFCTTFVTYPAHAHSCARCVAHIIL